MKVEVKNFDRAEQFGWYHNKDNPFLFVTTKLDITNIYNKCKNHCASIAYFITLVVNDIDNFKYRYEDGKIYKYDVVKPNFTQMFDDHNIGYFTCDFKDNYSAFIVEYKKVQEKFIKNQESCTADDQGEIWFSCSPWFQINSMVTPYDKSITVPQFLWDKFTLEDGKCFINLTISVHHGFADGYHIGLFLQKLNDIIENLDQYL